MWIDLSVVERVLTAHAPTSWILAVEGQFGTYHGSIAGTTELRTARRENQHSVAHPHQITTLT